MAKAQTVALLGASGNPSRYAYLAFHKLQQHGHTVIPVNPRLKTLEGTPVKEACTLVLLSTDRFGLP